MSCIAAAMIVTAALDDIEGKGTNLIDKIFIFVTIDKKREQMIFQNVETNDYANKILCKT